MGNNHCCSTHNLKISGSDQDGRPQTQMVGNTDVNGCKIVLSLGKLFSEDVDAVVVPTNPKLKLSSAISEHIKKYGGLQVLNELQQTLLSEGGKVQQGQVVYTHAGEMRYDYIFYAVLPSCTDASVIILNESHEQDAMSSVEDYQKVNSMTFFTEKKKLDSTQAKERQVIYEAVINCLDKASELGVKTIAFQVMESSMIHISKAKIAAVTLFAIKTFLREYQSKSTLKEIRITNHESPAFTIYKHYLHQILSDQQETTIDRLFQQEEQIYQQEFKNGSQSDLRIDDIRKFCHGCKEGIDNDKQHKASF